MDDDSDYDFLEDLDDVKPPDVVKRSDSKSEFSDENPTIEEFREIWNRFNGNPWTSRDEERYRRIQLGDWDAQNSDEDSENDVEDSESDLETEEEYLEDSENEGSEADDSFTYYYPGEADINNNAH